MSFSLGAVAAEPERNKNEGWDALVAQAIAHGAVETQLDRSASYVFQTQDGSFLTFTRLLATPNGRSICLVSKAETATACVDWTTGKLTLGDRADAATPWRFHSVESLAAFEAAQPGFLDKLTSTLMSFVGLKGKGGGGPKGFYRETSSGSYKWVPLSF